MDNDELKATTTKVTLMTEIDSLSCAIATMEGILNGHPPTKKETDQVPGGSMISIARSKIKSLISRVGKINGELKELA